MLKRFLIAAGLACLVAFEASATVNIRQNGDGTADWVGSSDAVRFGNCVGGANVQIPVQLNQRTTGYGVSPVSNAVIRGVYGVTPTATTGNAAVLRVYANQTTTPVRFISSTTSLATHATLQFLVASAGTVARISRAAEVSGASLVTNNTLEEGHYIAVGSDGGATGLATANVIVQVCPR